MESALGRLAREDIFLMQLWRDRSLGVWLWAKDEERYW
jgi:hypothetical protein